MNLFSFLLRLGFLVMAWAIPWVSVWWILSRVFRRKENTESDQDRWWQVWLGTVALLLSLGFSAVTFFVWRTVAEGGVGYFVAEGVFWLLLLGGVALKTKGETPVIAQENHDAHSIAQVVPPEFVVQQKWLRAAVWVVLTLAGVVFLFQSLHEPHGTNDAIGIWNFHARVLHLTGSEWREFFVNRRHQNRLSSVHPDYPFLLPASIARGWSVWDSPHPFVSVIVATMMTVATLFLCGSTIALLRGTSQAWLALLCLGGTLSFTDVGANQYADIPLAGYCLASLSCVLVGNLGQQKRWFFLGGILAGLAAWTKNEGQLFVVAFGLVLCIQLWRTIGLKPGFLRILCFGFGLLFPLVFLFYNKWYLPMENDLWSGQTPATLWGRFSDPTRWQILGGHLIQKLWKLTHGFLIAFPVYFLLMGRSKMTTQQPLRMLAGGTVLLMLLGDCTVYLLTPHDLEWHLNTSLKRLLLQLWPMFLVWYFLSVQTQEERLHES